MDDSHPNAPGAEQPTSTDVVVSGGDVSKNLPDGYSEANQQSLAVSLARAEVDQQIATAQALPRSITRAVQNIMTLATLDEETAAECIYALPRAGKAIKGPSIRMAEIISSQWGNCRVGARVVHVDRFDKYVEAEGVFHDLETNTATTARVRRRISDKKGKLLNEDMINVTGNAAASIAKRNAILGGVPRAVWRKAYQAVEHVLAGDIKTLAERREKAMKAFAAFGVAPEQIFAVLDIGGIDDITIEHMSTLTGMRSALKNGEANVEEMFPKITDANGAGKPKSLDEKLDKLAKSGVTEDEEVDPKTGEVTDKPTGEAAAATDKEPAGENKPETGASADASPSGGGAAATPKATAKKAVDSAAPPSSGTSAAAFSIAEQTAIKRFTKDLESSMTEKKLQALANSFLTANETDEDSNLGMAAAQIYELNRKRVQGELSISEVEQEVRRVLA